MRAFIATMTALLLASTAFGGVPTYYPISDDETPAVEANTDSQEAYSKVAVTDEFNVYDELASIQRNYKRGTDIGVLRERIQETYAYLIEDEYYYNLRSDLYYLIEDRFIQKSLFIR